MNLSEIRDKIDQVDMKLIKLLHERMEYGLRAGKLKKRVNDPNREEQLMQKLAARSSLLLDPRFITSLYSVIIEQSRRLQEKNLKLVGFQGEHGAWGEIAVRQLNREIVSIPCLEFADVFSGVADRIIDCGMVPVENSLEGAVTEVNDMLVETDLKIRTEVTIPVHQCLLSLPRSDYREIKVVYSHPQALAQCRSFLSRNKLEPRPFYDTAGAARWLAHEKPRSAGVIASRLAADIYGLEIIKEDIEDNPENHTRFVLLGREEDADADGKCSIAFSTQHRAGALYEILQIFAENAINLTRIESRPVRKNPGVFAFLLDFLGSRNDPVVNAALEKVKKAAVMYRNLGFYREAGR